MGKQIKRYLALMLTGAMLMTSEGTAYAADEIGAAAASSSSTAESAGEQTAVQGMGEESEHKDQGNTAEQQNPEDQGYSEDQQNPDAQGYSDALPSAEEQQNPYTQIYSDEQDGQDQIYSDEQDGQELTDPDYTDPVPDPSQEMIAENSETADEYTETEQPVSGSSAVTESTISEVTEEEKEEEKEDEEQKELIVKATAVIGDTEELIGDAYTDISVPVTDDVLDLTQSLIKEDVTRAVPVEGTNRLYVESFQYDYATIGGAVVTSAAKEELTEETVILLHYSNVQTKTNYIYEDSDISVTAVVQDPNAIPDNAWFNVTRITPYNNEAAYGAYLEALNNQAEDIAVQKGESAVSEYQDSNTLLYDISFLVPKADEEGNIIDGEYVEIKPDSDVVSISFRFLKNQLTQELGVEQAEDVTVIHLPLADQAVADADSTQDAFNSIVSDDISAEVVGEQSTNVGSTEEVWFDAESFSAYAFVYTVDFHYEGTDYSIPGYTQILLSELIGKLHITVDGTADGELINILDVADVTFTNEELVKVEKISGLVTYQASEEETNTVDVGEQDWLLSSKGPFSSDEKMTITLKDGRVIEVAVTDAAAYEVEIQYVDGSGAPIESVTLPEGKYYYVYLQTNYQGDKVCAFPLPADSGTTQVTEFYDTNNTSWAYVDTMNVSEHSIRKKNEQATEQMSSQWAMKDVNGNCRLRAGDKFDGLEIVSIDTSDPHKAVFTLKELPKYTISVKAYAKDGNPASPTFNENYHVRSYLQKENIPYFAFGKLALNGNGEQTIAVASFAHRDDPNRKENYSPETSVKTQLVVGEEKNLEQGIADGTILTSSDGKLYVLRMSSVADGMNVTLREAAPYKYSIAEAKGSSIAFDPDYQSNWYLLSTLKKADGGTYYYVKSVDLQGQSAVPASGTDEIGSYYKADDLGTVSIGSEGNAAKGVYESGDTVTNELIHVSSQAQNYKQIVSGDNNGREAFGDGGVANKYTVSSTSENGVGTITLTPVSEFKVKTEFKDAENHTQSAADISGITDYKLLIKMVRGGKTYYALHTVDTGSNPSGESDPVVFYEYSNGTLGSTPNYYSGNGSETISTQVVTGTDDLKDAIEKKTEDGVIHYNENTVGGKQSSDLTRDLYSTSSAIADGTGAKVMTTTFVKQKDGGVDHDISVSFYKEHTDDIKNAELNPTDNNMSTEAGSYFFRVRLYNNGKLVAYKIVPVTTEEAAEANATGRFTHTISADEEFQLVDDIGVDIAGGTLHYDPTVYTSDVRFYRARTAGDLPAKLSEVSAKGLDTFEGYDFWQNVYGETKNGEEITKTKTDLALYSSYKKKYQVQIVIDGTTEPKTADKLGLYVQAHHQNPEDDIYNDPDIAQGHDFRKKTTSDGKIIITYLIEDQTTDPVDYNWTSHGSEHGLITGNETFTLMLTQNERNCEEGDAYPIKLGDECYTVSYDTENEEGKNVVIDDVTKVTTITHYVHLTKANYDDAIGPYDVLGEGAEYGVVADTYIRHDHTETNFAVRTYDQQTAAGIDIDASGTDHLAPFVMGRNVNGLHFANNNTTGLDVYTPVSEKNTPYQHTASDESTDMIHQDSYSFNVTVFPTDNGKIDSYVSELIDTLQASSAAYLNKPMYKPTGITADGYLFNRRQSSITGDAKVEKDETSEVVIVDSYTTREDIGSLVIRKTVGGDVTESEAAGALTFEVKTADGKWLKADGIPSETQSILTIADGFVTTDGGKTWTKTFGKVEIGNYTVTETNYEIGGYNFNSTDSVTEGSVEVKQGVFAESKDVATIELKDEYEKKAGVLALTKTLKGDITKDEAEGALTFQIRNAEGKYLGKDGKLYDMAQILTLKDFEQIDAANFRLEIKTTELGLYAVTETTKDIDGKTHTVRYSLNGGTQIQGMEAPAIVEDGKITTVAFEDTFTNKSAPVTEEYGTLVIKKTLRTLRGTITREQAEAALKFEVKTPDGKWLDKDGNVSSTKVELTLKDGFELDSTGKIWTKTFTRVAACGVNEKYTVTETATAIEGFTLVEAQSRTSAEKKVEKNTRTTLELTDTYTTDSSSNGSTSANRTTTGTTAGAAGTTTTTGAKTGDETNAALPLTASLLAMAVMLVLLQEKKKQNRG